MPYAESNDIKLYYETQGEGTPLLLINCWGGNLDSWSEYMVERLAHHHFVITMDNRGTGRSGKPDIPYTMKMMASDVSRVLNYIDIRAVHMLGFSMGGAIAQTFGLEYLGRVRSLILCGTTSGGRHKVDSSTEVHKELALIANPTPIMTERDRTIKLLYLLYPTNYVNNHLEELVLDENYTKHPTPDYALIRQSQAIAGFDSYDRLPEIRIPVLVMCGDRDIMVPPLNSKLLAERIPNSELVILKGAGHGFLKQMTDESVDKILGFLRRVDEPSPSVF